MGSHDIGDIQIQTHIPFQNIDEFQQWLFEWKEFVV